MMVKKYVPLAILCCGLLLAGVLVLVRAERGGFASAATNVPGTPPPVFTPTPATPIPHPTLALPTTGLGPRGPIGTAPPLPSVVNPGPPTGPPPTRNPNSTDYPGGGPAITVRFPNSDPLTPAFTAQDAVDYVLQHPPTQAHGTPITVANVTFAMARDLVAQGAADPGTKPDRLICYVQMNGTFAFGGPGGVGTGHTAYYYFDAHTGYYLAINIR